AGGGLDEVRAGELADFQRETPLVVVQKAGFHDHLDQLALVVGELGEAGDLGGDVAQMPGAQGGVVHDDVHLVRAGVVRGDDLGGLGFDGKTSAGKTDHRADARAGAGERVGGERHAGRIDHHAGEAVAGGLRAEIEDVGFGGVETEVGGVQRGGEGGGGQRHGAHD